jgi:integrase
MEKNVQLTKVYSPLFTPTEIVAHYLRRLHNLALDLGWLPWPILAKRAWPKIRSQSKRAITAEEHEAVIASEKNPERRAYYELLYESGAAQTDASNLTAEDIDWRNGVLVYRRKKLGPFSEPCRLTIGNKLRLLLNALPSSGDLFPNTANVSKSSVRRISPALPCRWNQWCKPPFISPRMGASCKGLWISTAICARSIGPQQSSCP